MPLFFHLFANIVPLYLLIAAGYIGGRYLNIDRVTLANLALYFCVPVVFFGFVVDLDLEPAYILLPVLVYALSALMGFAFLYAGKKIYGDNRANLLALCASMGNGGYFGLPVAMLLFDSRWVGVYMFMLLGGVLYEATIGYYIAARGQFTVRDSFIKLAKFPSIYAFAAALCVNLGGIELPDVFYTYWEYFRGAYVIIGMMIVGAALGKVDKFVVVPKFTALAFAGKFVVWPLLIAGFVALDSGYLYMFGPEIHKLLLLFAIVPPAANIAAFSAQMNLRPEKAATTILIGTVFALMYIPAMLMLMGMS